MNGKYPQARSVECLIEWLRIREASGKSFPHSVDHLEELLEHSSLYPRLLNGKVAFKDRPPLSYDQPWYDLIEKGYGLTHDVRESDHFDRHVYGWDMLFINKYPWRIIKKSSDRDFTVTYGSGADVFRASYRGIDGDAWWIERQSGKQNAVR